MALMTCMPSKGAISSAELNACHILLYEHCPDSSVSCMPAAKPKAAQLLSLDSWLLAKCYGLATEAQLPEPASQTSSR